LVGGMLEGCGGVWGGGRKEGGGGGGVYMIYKYKCIVYYTRDTHT